MGLQRGHSGGASVANAPVSYSHPLVITHLYVIGAKAYITYNLVMQCNCCFLTILSLFHNFLNQYQACLYLFECIFHGESKISHQMRECWHFLPKLDCWPVVCTAAWKALSYRYTLHRRVKTPFDTGVGILSSVGIDVKG